MSIPTSGPAPGVPILPDGPSFITVDDLRSGALSEVVNYASENTDAYLASLCVEASQMVEDTCERRLLPFLDLVETDVLTGVSLDGTGVDGEPLLGLTGALGLSEARAYGATAGCRELWVREFPPRRSELWTYTACSISLRYPWGGDPVALFPGQFDGPSLDTGRIHFRVGVMAPPGTEYTVTYSGGYLLGVPAPLRSATRWTAIRTLIRTIEPEMRPNMKLDQIDEQITESLAGYSKV